MIRTAQLMAGAPSGGAELFYERLCIALHRAGEAVLPLLRAEPARLERLREAGLAPQTAWFGGALDIATKPLLAAKLRRFAPRVAVAWMGRAAAHAPRGPWVLVGRLGGAYDLRRFAHCDHLVANTPGLRDWILGQGFPAARAHTLPNFVPDHRDVPPVELGLPRPLVLALGRLHRNKAFDVLLAALTRLPGLHAAIAGEGPERAALQTLAQQAGIADRVHFLGWREDVPALLAACDVLVCPSRVEPLGNAVLDGFSAARPVVAAASDGPRLLIDPGRTGVLVPVDSGVALAAGVEGVLADPVRAAAMAQAGRAMFEATYAEAAVLAEWRRFLSSVEKP